MYLAGFRANQFSLNKIIKNYSQGKLNIEKK